MAVDDVAQVAAAAGSAIAAIAAWRATAQMRRSHRLATEPRLSTQAHYVNGQAHVDVFNVGGGPAFGAAYVFVVGDTTVSGYMRDGTIQPGDAVRIRTNIALDANAHVLGVVACRGADGEHVTAWDLALIHRPRRFNADRDGSPLAMGQVFAAVVPDIDLKELHAGPSDVLTRDELNALPDPTYVPTQADILRPYTA